MSHLGDFLEQRTPMMPRIGAALLAFAAAFVGGWMAFPPSAFWNLVRGLDWPNALEILLGLAAFGFGVVLLLIIALAAALVVNALLRQTNAVVLSAIIATGIFAVMAQAIGATAAFQEEGVGEAEDFTTIADGIFDEHVIAFEVLGVLLTAAMIGAMVIARPLGRPTDDINYRTKADDDEVEALQRLSDVDTNLTGIPVVMLEEEE